MSKLTAALTHVFTSPDSLLKGLTAWQQCILQGREAKLAPAARPVLWDTGADALESQWRRQQGGIFRGAFSRCNSRTR